MNYIKEKILEAKEALRYEINILSTEESERVRASVEKKYLKWMPALFLWDAHLTLSYTSSNKNSWQWLDEFIHEETILFFDRKRELDFFQIPKNQSISKLIEELNIDEFYLTNQSLDYLFAGTDTANLIAAGSACDWFEKRDKEEQERLQKVN